MKLAVVIAVLMQWDMQPVSADWDMNPTEQSVAWSIAPASFSVAKPDLLIDSLPEPLATDEAAHTPMAEVVRVLNLLPRPQVGFVDFGCGYDARWCIAAAEKWGCKVTGIEIDPYRAAAARERVRNLGLSHLITIVEGDAGEVPVRADVGVAYLYPELLARLKPRLEALRAFASYLHQPAGMPVVKNGDSWVYARPPALVRNDRQASPVNLQAVHNEIYQQVQSSSRPLAEWGGQYYAGPVCSNPGCAMCNAIRGQIASQQAAAKQPASTGHWVKRCYGGYCRMEWVPG